MWVIMVDTKNQRCSLVRIYSKAKKKEKAYYRWVIMVNKSRPLKEKFEDTKGADSNVSVIT